MEMGSSRTLHAQGSVLWLRRFARTTPGIIGLIAVTIAALCVVAGVVCAAQLDRRIAERNAVLDRSEPFAYAAQNLYAALSAADAAAASEYLSAKETAPVRARYQEALAEAASALADATAGSADTDTRTAVANITAQLATYTGLVESARANNLQGHVIGSAYLREASLLMQATLLPGAEKIYLRNLTTFGEGQRAVGAVPIASLALLGMAFTAIVVGSVIVFARTNRQFNIGLVIAAAAVVTAGTWIVVATRMAATDIEQADTEGTTMFRQFAQARFDAETARANETLALIAHGDPTASEESFTSEIEDLLQQLGPAQSGVGNEVNAWIAGHRKQVEAYNAGDYNAAVQQAIGPSALQFADVETSLQHEIDDARAVLRDRVSAAGAWLAWSSTGTLALMVLAATAAVAGLWPRLQEFQ